MRPTKKKQDSLRAPLNELLSSEVNVRILRVLSLTESMIGRTAVARQAELNASGVRRSLDRLAQLGLVETTGSGRNVAVGLRARHPLAGPVRELFQAERKTYEIVVGTIREAVVKGGSMARAVWLESPSSRSPGSVDVGVLASVDNVDEAVRIVEKGLEQIAPDLASHFTVHGYTDADLSAADPETLKRLSQVTLLVGWIPSRWRTPGSGPIRSHRDLERSSLELGRWVAERLTDDPSILDRARHWIGRQLDSRSGPGTRDLEEWKAILENLSVRQIQSLLVEDTPRARRLRQSSPFLEGMSADKIREALQEVSSEPE